MPRNIVSTDPSFATLGEGRLAYVRTLLAEEVPNLFPQAPRLQPGLRLFALFSADGTPIMLTDTREAALANAWQHDLVTLSLH
ncbi:DUF1150 family protein [Candidatus Raskinella chloraquaticus]|jgi:hypothetical protein|uniref:NADH oxidase n=1 Tax=Candidatus Raskinella chloraquaticus TaxID=1951219 RepID=A0A1W9HQL6_9HYPH|nr:DUF1150 domain-containing protein [Hyphomicrobiales bacterium]OQW49547.1 MAG: hypothetical protein A4S15_02085 [Proteobacteria bacterium SG_bin8]OQW82899.1 MAG: hypothetical protein BVN31_07250 [Proteobacteria bacterium ST_bin15]